METYEDQHGGHLTAADDPGFTSAFLRLSQGVGGLAGCDTPSSRGGRVGRVGGRVDGAGGG